MSVPPDSQDSGDDDEGDYGVGGGAPAEQTAFPARDVSALRECLNCAAPADLDQESRELFQWILREAQPLPAAI